MKPRPPVYYDIRSAVRLTVRTIRFITLALLVGAFLIGGPAAASIWTGGQGL